MPLFSRRHRVPLLAAVVALAAGSVTALTGGDGAGAATSATAPVTYARYFFGTDRLTSPAVQAARWPLLIGQGNQTTQHRMVKAANPSGVRAVVYADPLFVRQTDPDGVTTVTRNADTFANHPEWFLLDAAGHRIQAKYFGNRDYAADIGNTAYQRAAVSFLLAKTYREGWDGVFLDDTNPTPEWTFAARPAKYPTDAAWQAAEQQFVSYVCGAVKAAGKRCYLNLGQRNTPWAQSIARMSSGPMMEFFVAMNPAVGGVPVLATIENGYWLDQMRWALWAEANTTQQIVHASTTDPAATTYALASYLLISTGKGAFAANRNYGSSAEGLIYPRALTDAAKLGAPTTGYVMDPSGVFYRSFTHGIVIVNPHSGPRTFRGHTLAAASGSVTLTG